MGFCFSTEYDERKQRKSSNSTMMTSTKEIPPSRLNQHKHREEVDQLFDKYDADKD
jgi:hypothetical protein